MSEAAGSGHEAGGTKVTRWGIPKGEDGAHAVKEIDMPKVAIKPHISYAPKPIPNVRMLIPRMSKQSRRYRKPMICGAVKFPNYALIVLKTS
jgi:hypothetical protein